MKGMMWSLEVKGMMCSSKSERRGVKDEQAAAIPQKLICNKASEHLNALQSFVGAILVVPWPIWKTSCRIKNYIHHQREKSYK